MIDNARRAHSKEGAFLVAAAVVSVAVTCSAGGYLVGKSRAPTHSDAIRERSDAYTAASRRGFAIGEARIHQHAVNAGVQREVRPGALAGRRNGAAAARQEASHRRAVAETQRTVP